MFPDVLADCIIGQLVGQFNDYFTDGSTQTQEEFEALVNKQR